MKDSFVDDVYNTLYGVMVKGYEVPNVVNLFETGSPCDVLYNNMLAAYERLLDRLQEVDEDTDVEIMIDSLQSICYTMCMHMYHYGAVFGEKNT